MFLYGCETYILTLSEEHRLKVLENRMEKRIFGTEDRKSQKTGENCIMSSFIGVLYSPPILIR
jgi:hypothetical protein